MSDTLILLPDIEQLLVGFYRAQDEINELDLEHDELLVCTVLPKTKQWPALRITRFGGLPVTNTPLHLDAPTVQIDAYGGPKKQAWRLAETSRALLAGRVIGSHAEGHVNGVTFGALGYVPDVTFSPAQPRYLYTATLYTHPLPAGS